MPLTPQTGRQGGEFFSRYLDTNGDGTGTKNAIGNFAGAVTDFFISPAARTQLVIARLIIQVSDVGPIVPAGYGNLAALVNGISLLHFHDTTLFADYMDGLPVTTNGNWARTSYDVDYQLAGGIGENYIETRWSFNRASDGIVLHQEDSLVMRLNDNFTGIESQTFCAQGELYE